MPDRPLQGVLVRLKSGLRIELHFFSSATHCPGNPITHRARRPALGSFRRRHLSSIFRIGFRAIRWPANAAHRYVAGILAIPKTVQLLAVRLSFMTRFGPARRARMCRETWIPLSGLACLLIVAPLLMSLTSPQAAEAQSPGSVAIASGPGAEMVEGVPLVPTSREQRSQCLKFANHLKKPVPCPGLLPDPIPVSPTSAATLCPGDYGAFGEGSCGPAGIEVVGNLFEISQSNFQVPSGYVGVSFVQNNGAVAPETSISGGALGHFVFMSGTDMRRVMTNGRGRGAAPVPPYCSPLKSSGLGRVQGHVAKLYQCADASNSPTEIQIIEGHTLLVWSEGGVTCEVSFHGHSQVNVDLDFAVANATILVKPRGR